MRKRFHRRGLLALVTVAVALVPASVAAAHPFVIEGTGNAVPLTNNQMLVVFQCGAFDLAAPLGSHLTECYVISRATGLRTDAQIRTTGSLWQGTAFMPANGRYSLCAGGYVNPHLSVPRQDIATTCTVSFSRQAVLLLTGPS